MKVWRGSISEAPAEDARAVIIEVRRKVRRSMASYIFLGRMRLVVPKVMHSALVGCVLTEISSMTIR
jgi:hypothetical protein